MKRLTLLSLALLFLLIGGWTYHIYAKNEQLTDPSFVYDHYLKLYEAHHYRLVAVQYTLKPGFIVQWEPHWKIYLYTDHRLIELDVNYRGESTRNYSTVLDYSTIGTLVENFRSLDLPARDYSTWIYVPNGDRLVEYRNKCMGLGEVLDNGTIKLINSTFSRDFPNPRDLKLIKMKPIGGVLALHYYRGCECSATWVVFRPYNETHDLIRVVYPWGVVEGHSPALNVQPFNGTYYLKLADKLKNRYCEFLGGVIVNATGIYVNPNAEVVFQKVIEKARKERRRLIIPSITIYRNGTIKEGGIGVMWPSYGSG